MTSQPAPVAALIAALHEAREMEHHSLLLLTSQLQAVPDHNEVAPALNRHLRETREQLRRLEIISNEMGEPMEWTSDESASWACRFPLSGAGHQPSLLTQWWLTSISFETFEAAAYLMLTALARSCQWDLAVSLLRRSLLEEYQMVSDLEASIDDLVSASMPAKHIALY